MGFDLSIKLIMSIDPKTGLPYVWVGNLEKKSYVPSEYEVPEKYRKWVVQRGQHFHAYIKNFDSYETSVENFYYEYPTWATVEEELGNNSEYDYWTESDHYDFKDALEWFAQKSNFMVEWSY